ncbi:MAG: pyridoxal phosphate-dependent decarboxylase family protein [Bdellovibrionia bacterium]
MKKCDSQDLAIKSFFLGPQSENADWLKAEIDSILEHWFLWRKSSFQEDGTAISAQDQLDPEFRKKQIELQQLLRNLQERFKHEIPQYSPRYVGHMYSELSMPAILGHFLALIHNPNIISTEAAKVGAHLEEEAIKALGAMFRFPSSTCTGHFTSGGTVANIEALWRARYRLDHFLALGSYLNETQNLKMSYVEAAHMGWAKYEQLIRQYHIPEPILRQHSAVALGPWKTAEIYKRNYGKYYQGAKIFVSNSKHYSWLKAISLLGMGDISFEGIDLNAQGQMKSSDLIEKCNKAFQEDTPIALIVSVAGTTELGTVDPIAETTEYLKHLREDKELHLWHHIDAAYGGYFASAIKSLDKNTANDFLAIQHANSVTLDPHKLGYVPYACGAFLVPNEENNRVSAFEAKYIQSPQKNIDRWLKTIEGSRAATGATATWMTVNSIGLHEEGFGKILEKTITAKSLLLRDLQASTVNLLPLKNQNLNLVCLVQKDETNLMLSQTNKKTETLIDNINASGKFIVSKTTLKLKQYQELISEHCQDWKLEIDCDELVLLRMTLMNPFLITKETKKSYLHELTETLIHYSKKE